MLEYTLDISGRSFLRQLDGLLLGSVTGKRHEVSRRCDQFAMIEQSIVNGLLPDPGSRASAEKGWLDTRHWDFLIGLHSTSTPGYPSLTYASYRMAIKKCGLYQGLVRGTPKINELKKARRDSLFPRLVECGFLELEDDPPYREELTWYRKCLAPMWPADSERPVVSHVAKTRASLESYHRSFFMMPEAIINDGTWLKAQNHTYRRVITALYLFFDDATYASVNPNHLRVSDGHILEASASFMRACGETATLKDVAGVLSWLWNERRLFGMDCELEPGEPFPAGREYVTWSRPVARNIPSGTIVFVPYYVPATGGIT
ncbi:MAG: hypothetical protein FD171_681 [Actinobacteria bacterium]|nr:MAG: hypothetical protein FD171_681 [Actinomycetota bacterium]